MERLKQVMQQPTKRRAGFLDSMYVRALRNKSDVTDTQEVITIIEQVQPSIRQNFQPHVEKLRGQVAAAVTPEVIGNTQNKSDATDTQEVITIIEQVQPSIRPNFQPKTITIEGKSESLAEEDLKNVEVIFVWNASQFLPVRQFIEAQFPV